MTHFKLPADLAGFRIHMVGIKGTGMAALAELLVYRGAVLSGSDVPEVFYTDEILHNLGIPVMSPFSADNLSSDIRLVIHSAAYRSETNPSLPKRRRESFRFSCIPRPSASFPRTVSPAGSQGSTERPRRRVWQEPS